MIGAKFTPGFILFGISLLLVTACKEKEEIKSEVLRPVKYEVVGLSSLDGARSFTGVAEAANKVELSFRGSGIITSVNVGRGQRVEKGTLIAALDNIEPTLDYEKSVAQVASARSALNTAKNDLERAKVLFEKGTLPLSEYEQSKDRYENALAQFESANRNKSIQETKLTYGYIYAPSDGIIAETNGDMNERVQAGHLFATLISGKGVKINIGVPGVVVNEIELGMPAIVSFPSIPDREYAGEVDELSPIILEGAATYPLSIKLIEPDASVKPGMAAEVSMSFGRSADMTDQVYAIPMTSVGEDGSGNYVFLIEPQDNGTGVVKKHRVEVAGIVSDKFEIASGLESGQFIATAGMQTLLDGQRVRLLTNN